MPTEPAAANSLKIAAGAARVRRAKVGQDPWRPFRESGCQEHLTCNSTSQLFKITRSYLAASLRSWSCRKGVVRLCLTVKSMRRAMAFRL